MKLQKLLSLIRQAIDEYGMIQENDKIAVGISGDVYKRQRLNSYKKAFLNSLEE